MKGRISMKVLVCDNLASEAIDVLKKEGYTVDVKTGMSPEEVNQTIGEYDGVVVRSATKIRKEQIDSGKKLKVIARAGVGVDNIDVEYAKSKQISVVNTPAATSISVAELALAHMFGLVRFMGLANMSMKEGKWEKKSFSKGVELFGKTLGILGIGRIGQELAKRAHGLGMKVIFYDAVEFPVDGPYERKSFDDVISQADFISIHTPKTDGFLIDKAQFNKMKKGVYLINCARGGIVNETALIEAIKDGTVAGAGIDVWQEEPTNNQDLVNLPQVFATPHLGASTNEGQVRAGVQVAERMITVFNGDTSISL
jgi:D-3-phosphoglycerate dehydrogenase / 2-oxoglutarate reductase